jgi:hypothetical protein
MFVTEVPGSIAATAGVIAGVGAAMQGVNAAMAEPVSAVIPAGLDDVSFLVAGRHNIQGVMHIAAQAEGAAVLANHVATLTASEMVYDTTEAVNMVSL